MSIKIQKICDKMGVFMIKWVVGFVIVYLILIFIVYIAHKKVLLINDDDAWIKTTDTFSGLIAVLAIIILLVFNSFIKSFNTVTTQTNANQEMDWSHYYNDTEHKATYQTIMKYAVDKYINGVKWPSWNFSDYSFIDYDKTNSGTILGSIKVGVDGLIEKQDVYVVFTIIDGIKDYRVNSVVVGNKTYYDDGKMANLLRSFN